MHKTKWVVINRQGLQKQIYVNLGEGKDLPCFFLLPVPELHAAPKAGNFAACRMDVDDSVLTHTHPPLAAPCTREGGGMPCAGTWQALAHMPLAFLPIQTKQNSMPPEGRTGQTATTMCAVYVVVYACNSMCVNTLGTFPFSEQAHSPHTCSFSSLFAALTLFKGIRLSLSAACLYFQDRRNETGGQQHMEEAESSTYLQKGRQERGWGDRTSSLSGRTHCTWPGCVFCLTCGMALGSSVSKHLLLHTTTLLELAF